MTDIVTENINTIRRSTDRAKSLINDLYSLDYFDKTNYEKNIKDLQFSLVNEDDGKLFQEGQFAMYFAPKNSVLVKESMIYDGIISEEYFSILLLHELVHMASTNREKNVIGFEHEAVPLTYNEACTQYLTLKLFYKDKLKEGIDNNIYYHDSVKTISNCIDALGEKTIFDGFFEADLKKNVDGFTPKVLDKWIDYVMEMSSSLEEQYQKSNMEALRERVEEVNEKR